MPAFWAAIVLCAVISAYALSVRVFNQPRPPEWTRRRLAGELVAVSLTGGIGIGGAFLFTAIEQSIYTAVNLVDIAAAAVVLGATVYGMRALASRRARPMAQVVDLAAHMISDPANDVPPVPVGGGRRAA